MIEIVPIFNPRSAPDHGLLAIKLDNEPIDEFAKIMAKWKDPEEMMNYCKNNLPALRESYGYLITADEAAMKLMDEAMELRFFLLQLATKQKPGTNLQQIFKPLDNSNTSLTELQLSKASAKTRERKDPKLRIYAIRLDENTYIVTGGAIKLTKYMREAEDTRIQLQRMNKVRDWLKDQGISFAEDLNEL